MALKFMYITNRPDVALIAEAAGVDRIFVDMEYIGKGDRQGGMDTVQSHHTPEDVRAVKSVLTRAEVMVRCNPIHAGSAAEIDAVIEAGADIVMLPYFKTVEELRTFISLVGGRARILPLVETPEAVACIDGLLALSGIDEIFVGLNDLSLGYGCKFMFELLADGTVEALCLKFRQKGIPFGFGGIAALGSGMLPSERIIREHYRLGSSCAILSRSFCNVDKIGDLDEIREIFDRGVREIRALEAECDAHMSYFWQNREELRAIVDTVVRTM